MVMMNYRATLVGLSSAGISVRIGSGAADMLEPYCICVK